MFEMKSNLNWENRSMEFIIRSENLDDLTSLAEDIFMDKNEKLFWKEHHDVIEGYTISMFGTLKVENQRFLIKEIAE